MLEPVLQIILNFEINDDSDIRQELEGRRAQIIRKMVSIWYMYVSWVKKTKVCRVAIFNVSHSSDESTARWKCR